MSKAKKTSWKRYIKGLTPAQRDKILVALLEVHFERYDDEISFREADEEGEAAVYWTGNGESLLK